MLTKVRSTITLPLSVPLRSLADALHEVLQQPLQLGRDVSQRDLDIVKRCGEIAAELEHESQKPLTYLGLFEHHTLCSALRTCPIGSPGCICRIGIRGEFSKTWKEAIHQAQMVARDKYMQLGAFAGDGVQGKTAQEIEKGILALATKN